MAPDTGKGKGSLLLALVVVACMAETPLENQPPDTEPASASVVTTSDTLVPEADAFVRSIAPNKNYGANDSLTVRSFTSSSSRFNVFVRFDEEAIEAQIGAGQLDSARLELLRRDAGSWPAAGDWLNVYRVPQSWAPAGWTESGITANCPNDTNTSNGGLDCPSGVWDTTGFGTLLPTDQVLMKNNTVGWVSFDVTADVNAWLAGTANGGWHIAKQNNSNNQRIVFWSHESAQQPRLVLFVTRDLEVPPEAPDTLPSWVYSPTNVDSNTTALPGAFLRNIVVVQFKESATQAQRQAAIEAVGGHAVGGVRFSVGEGYYYLQVADSTGGADLLAKTQILQNNSEVAAATIEHTVEAAYRRPKENATWSQWNLDPLAVGSTENWGLEAVSAPMAWGCETGSAATRVAVVDFGMGQTPPSDVDHLQFHPPLNSSAPSPDPHGFVVASILNARGNNDTAMTGMMWAADLHGFDPGQVGATEGAWLIQLMSQIRAAGASGASVINVSLQVPRAWPEPVKASAGRLFRGVLDDLGKLPRPSLVVLAAGNHLMPADTAGFPRANSPKHPRLLVVAGSNRQRTLFAYPPPAPHVDHVGSNYGPLVDVAAPGGAVFGLVAGQSPTRVDGTSYAAPIVAGIAGLLASFDGSLSADSLKILIVSGATAGAIGGSGGPYPLVDAYQSLRLAAQRRGAPLCGNRLWIEGQKIMVERGGTAETLVDVGDQIYSLQTWHGGRRVSYFADTSFGSALLSGGTWTKAGLLPSDELLAAGYAFSHEGDRLVYGENLSSMEIVDVVVSDTGYSQSVTVKSLPARWPGGGAVNHCVVESRPKGSEGGWTCNTVVDLWWGINNFNHSDPGVVYAFHPGGDSIFIARPWSSIHNVMRSTAGCPFGQPSEFYDYRCYNVDFDFVVDSSTIYRAAISSNATLISLFTVPQYVSGISIGESGRGEMVLFTQALARHTKALTSGWTNWDWVSNDCNTEFRSGYTTVTQSFPGGCSNGWLAPIRAKD